MCYQIDWVYLNRRAPFEHNKADVIHCLLTKCRSDETALFVHAGVAESGNVAKGRHFL